MRAGRRALISGVSLSQYAEMVAWCVPFSRRQYPEGGGREREPCAFVDLLGDSAAGRPVAPVAGGGHVLPPPSRNRRTRPAVGAAAVTGQDPISRARYRSCAQRAESGAQLKQPSAALNTRTPAVRPSLAQSFPAPRRWVCGAWDGAEGGCTDISSDGLHPLTRVRPSRCTLRGPARREADRCLSRRARTPIAMSAGDPVLVPHPSRATFWFRWSSYKGVRWQFRSPPAGPTRTAGGPVIGSGGSRGRSGRCGGSR